MKFINFIMKWNNIDLKLRYLYTVEVFEPLTSQKIHWVCGIVLILLNSIFSTSMLICSAFFQIPQSYSNDVHLVPSVVLRDNELLTKLPMDIDTWKMQEENILTAWQTPVSIRALIGWLQVRGCRFKSLIFFFFHFLLCAVKLKG